MSRSRLLDALSLQTEIVEHFHTRIVDAFKYFALNRNISSTFATSQPEIRALLESAFLYATLKTLRATFGQRTLGVQLQGLDSLRTVGFIVLEVGLPYLERRRKSSRFDAYIEHLKTAIKGLQLLNLLVFLQRGVYPSLTNRVLGLRPTFDRGPQQFSDEILARELLWSTLIETLVAVIPLINVRRIKSFLEKQIITPLVGRKSTPSFTSCAFCERPPIIPSVSACSHVFCYICLAGNVKADADFECPACGITQEARQLRRLCLR